MATDDDASAADPDGDGDDALEGDGDDLPSTREGDAVDRDAGTSSADGAGGLQPTDDDDLPADGSTAQPTADSDERSDRQAATGEADDSEPTDPEPDGPRVAVGEYTWPDFLDEYGVDGDVETLYDGLDPRAYAGDDEENARWDDGVEISDPTREDWDEVSVDAESHLGFHPVDTEDEVVSAISEAQRIQDEFEAFCDPETTPVVKDVWLWEHYKRAYYYEADGSRPRDTEGEIERFDETEALGFDPEAIEDVLAHGAKRAEELDEVVEERTVDVSPDLDEDAFFTDERGATTVVNRYDLEKAVPMEKKTHFREVERYWVNEPHSFVIIFHSTKENEKKYYAIEPHQNKIESDLAEYLTGKLRTAIKYDDESVVGDGPGTRRRVIEQQSLELLERYNLYQVPAHPRQTGLSVLATPNGNASDEKSEDGFLSKFEFDLPFGSDDEDAAAESDTDANTADASTAGSTAADGGTQAATTTQASESQRPLASIARSLGLREGSLGGRLDGLLAEAHAASDDPSLDGISARPEPAVLADDSTTLTDYQVEKLLYVLRRDFIGYERIDPIKHDVNVEDISCDGYNSPVFVYHSDYEQIISNIYHGEDELDDFVVKLAQRSGKGISKRRPQVDATLPDGSRAQLTLGREVSDHGTNYTIRQFKDVPFTPVDLINWKTFSLEEMAFLWLCIENDKSLIFAGGTASGKTTSLNAVSLFIPSNSKIVSIEDTREVELPQRNWVASVTRPSFSDDDRGDVDEFDLLEAALRQRPDYIVMGEIRGEEGRTLFQVMSTGHTTYTTFHADSVGEVLKRFTTDPINVSKTMFTALDLVSIQTSTRVQGNKVRRNKSLTEINHYDAENDEINVQDVYQWQAEGDEFLKMGSSNTLEDVRFDRGWTRAELDEELFKRRVVLAYLIDRGLNTYTQVAATLQAFINDQETILALMARDDLERSLEDLREMESVEIDVDPEKEEMVPRPSPGAEIQEICTEILERAEEGLWPDYRDLEDVDVADALLDVETAPDVTAATGDHPELDALEDRTDAPELDDGSETPTLDEGPETPEIDGESGTPALDPGPDESGAAAEDDAVSGPAADNEPPPEEEFGLEDLLEESSGDETEDVEPLGDDDGDIDGVSEASAEAGTDLFVDSAAEANGGSDPEPAVDEDGSEQPLIDETEESDDDADESDDDADEVDADGADEVDADGADEVDADGADEVDADGADEVDAEGADEVDAEGADEVDAEGADEVDADAEEADADGEWDFGDVRQVDDDGEEDQRVADEDESTEPDR